MNGIHFTKRPDHPELRNYAENDYRYYGSQNRPKSFLVKCALSGTIVVTEQGFRAQHVQIIGVVLDGNWTSYQDFAKCAAGYSDRDRQAEWEEKQWRFNYRVAYGKAWKSGSGSWDISFDPSADS
jgi:hypothetical protein